MRSFSSTDANWLTERKFKPKLFQKTLSSVHDSTLDEDAGLQWFPKVVEFSEVECGVTRYATLTVTNVSSLPKRIKLVRPSNRCLSCAEQPIWLHLVSGLSKTFKLRLNLDNVPEKDVSLGLILAFNSSQKIEIPVIGRIPTTDVKFPSVVDLGSIALNSSGGQSVAFENQGSVDCFVEVKFAEDSGVSLIPSKFALKAKGPPVSAHLTVSPKEAGSQRISAEVNLGHEFPAQQMEVIFDGIDHQARLVHPNRGTPITDVDFGSIYFNHEKTFTAVLVNDGPKQIMFSTEMKPNGEHNTEDEGSDDFSVMVTPNEGLLAPNSKQLLTLKYRPQPPERIKGYSSKVNLQEESRPIKCHLEITSKGLEPVNLPLAGLGHHPMVSISDNAFPFGECDVHDERSFLFTMQNIGEVLPVDFRFKRVPHFSFEPMGGLLRPGEVKRIILSYKPKCLGKHSGQSEISLANGSRTIPISMTGNAPRYKDGQTRFHKRVGGTDKLPIDFRKARTWVRPEMADKFEETLHDPYAVEPAEDLHTKPKWNKSTCVSSKVVDVHSDPYYVHLDQIHAEEYKNLNYTLSIEERHLRETAIWKANTFVGNSRKKREKTEKEKRSTKLDQTCEITQGMTFGSGIEGPMPALPEATETLWLKYAMAGYSGAKGAEAKAAVFDDNRLIKKKFKDTPITQAETRDCAATLQRKDLKSIRRHPELMDFGDVCVHSRTTKNFSVFNPLEKNILVSMAVESEELSVHPLKQVIPPGKTAGFDVTFQSARVQNYSGGIVYRINERHAKELSLAASVIPMDLKLSTESMEFAFSPTDMRFQMNETFVLTNPLTASAKFKINCRNPCFSFTPDHGQIDSGKKQKIQVTWSPNKGSEFVEEGIDEILISVVDGSEKVIKAHSFLPLPKCSTNIKSVDFGDIPVGVDVSKRIRISNNGQHTTVRIASKPKGVVVSDECFLLNSQGSLKLTVSFRVTEKHSCDGNLVFEVRGGKPIKIAVKVNAKMPEIQMENDVCFDKVTVGANRTRTVTLRNRGKFDSIYFVDLSQHHDFTLLPPPEKMDPEGKLFKIVTQSMFDLGCKGKVKLRSSSRAPSAASFATTNAEEGGNDSQGLYMITLPSEGELKTTLRFQPSSVETHEFDFPIFPAGIHDFKVNSTVLGEGLPARVTLSEPRLDFGKVIVSTAGSDYTKTIKLTNQEDTAIGWRLVIVDRRLNIAAQSGDSILSIDVLTHKPTWKINDIHGVLQPLQEKTLTIQFYPEHERLYEECWHLFLDEDIDPYLQLSASGVATLPAIRFSEPMVVLPTTPLNVRSTGQFQIINDGYEKLELSYKIPQLERDNIPLVLRFPKGKKLGGGTDVLPVEVLFLSPKPVAFTARIDFYDPKGAVFSLQVMGMSDNCVLTTQPFLYMHNVRIEPDSTDDGELPMLEVLSRRKPVQNTSTISSAHSSGPSQLQDINLLIQFLTASNLLYLEPDVNLESFPSLILNDNAINVADMVEFLSGARLANRYKAKKDVKESLVIKAEKLLKQAQKLTNHLRMHGALLTIKSEYCLTSSQAKKLHKKNANKDDPEAQQRRRIQEKAFPLNSYRSWTQILFQVVKVFILNRITLKHVLTQPMMKRDLFTNQVSSKSNVFSPPELLLLKWYEVHLSQEFSLKPITDFAQLRDGVAFAAAIRAHVPYIVAVRNIHEKPQTEAQIEENATAVVMALKELGLPLRPTSKDLTSGIRRNLLLIALYLYRILPAFVSKCSISFSSRLHQSVTKSIKISNPSKQIIAYKVRVEGSSEYLVEKDQIVLQPKEKIDFEVTFKARFTAPSPGRLIFAPISTDETPTPGVLPASLIFDLKSSVTFARPHKTIPLETMLYAPKEIDLEVDNPFDVDGDFAITVKQMQTKTDFPEFWHSKANSISVKGGETATFPFQFLPFLEGDSKCQIMFLDPKVGEFMYEVHGKCLPSAYEDEISCSCKDSDSMSRDITVSFRNPQLRKARQIAVDRLPKGASKTKAKDRLKTPLQTGPMHYHIESSSPYFICPSEFVMQPDKSSEKLHITFNPKGPGEYPCNITLKSEVDTRRFQVTVLCQSEGTFAELDFCAPAGANVLQQIPIVNSTDSSWNIKANISGNFFSGPAEVSIPPNTTDYYPLEYKPNWIYEGKGKLVLSNSATDEKYVYDLSANATEPLAKDQISINCKARQPVLQKFSVKNDTAADIEYRVESDLPHISGAKSFLVKSRQTGEYELSITPQMGGVMNGSITFTDPDGKFQWYAVEVHAEPPDPEKRLSVRAFVRKTVAIEINIQNPLNDVVEFDVDINGLGLSGDSILAVGGRQTVIYTLLYSPLHAREQEGGVYFSNDKLGEFWYVLDLAAEEPPAVKLPEIRCAIGETGVSEVVLENPTKSDIAIVSRLSNPRNFKVRPAVICILPFSSKTVQIVYAPSVIEETQECEVAFFNETVGQWLYEIKGMGSSPTQEIPVLHITSPLHQRLSRIISFRNPFDFPLPVRITMKTEYPNAFELFQRRAECVIPANTLKQVTVLFCPEQMTNYDAILSMEVCEVPREARLDAHLPLIWRHKVTGVPTIVSKTIQNLTCPAREKKNKVISLQLEHLHEHDRGEQTFSYEIRYLEQHKSFFSRALQVKCINQTMDPFEEPLRFQLSFQPLRPIRSRCYIVVDKPSGGRWEFPLQVEATEPDVDDIIQMESLLHQTSSVTFKLHNQFSVPAKFEAGFTPESPFEFSVHPKEGFLAPPGEQGTQFVVSFTPKEYGKHLVGKLIVQTEEMQWSYEVRGRPPKYVPPGKARRTRRKKRTYQ